LNSGKLSAQAHISPDGFEQVFSYWAKGLENTRQKLEASTTEFMTFQRFYEKQIDSLRAIFLMEIGAGKIDSLNATGKIKEEERNVSSLYQQFKIIEKTYPSSVDEYRHAISPRMATVCDTSGCTNIGFEQGTLNGWNAFYGFNNNSTGTFNFFNVTNLTGGPAGAITQAANDALTFTAGFYNAGVGANPSPDYQITITSGTRGDALVPTVPVVSPYGGQYSVMLGDSTMVNYGVAILSKTFLVSAANADFTYQYAVFLENPSGHTYYTQPFFQVALLDQNGDTIPFCGQYQVVSSAGGVRGFSPVYIPPNGTVGNDTAFYKDWTVVSVPLKKYIGQCVTIIFETGDCSKGGHFGYAYVDASCAPLQIITSSPAICGQRYITLTGPPGFVSYHWSSNTGVSLKGDTTQSIQVDSAGTYTLIVIPVTGISCSDTLSVTVPKVPGPPPIPSFKADTACTGQSTIFTNTSIPLSGPGVKFYWDFYNLGTFQDSSTNAAWQFNTPGTYYVKLYEIVNGCGADTTIKVIVVPPFFPAIFATNTDCQGNPITLTANGGGQYLWNTGATTSTITVSPSLSDTLFYVKVTNGCSDTAYHSIHIIHVTPVIACCDTTIYYGDSALVNASGSATNYIWSPSSVACITCANTKASPTSNTTYTITGTDVNGCASSAIVEIKIDVCGNTWIPNAFSPNKDGLNDVFAPKSSCTITYTMYIFNRWGALIYKSDNKPWDGTVKGDRVQEDTYVYKILVTTTDLVKRTYIGRVTVLK